MAKTCVFLIPQNVMVSQHRNTVIGLRVQTINLSQAIANANLKPGLVQAIFKSGNHGVAYIISQGAKMSAAALRLMANLMRINLCHGLLKINGKIN